jgi:hypothetical protein
LAESAPDQDELSSEWKSITGDSHIVDVRPISQVDPASGFIEVFKYAVKFSDQPEADTVHAWETLRGKRLVASSGCFRGVEVPDELDEALDLPYVTLFYRYLHGGDGYTLDRFPPPCTGRQTGGMGGFPPMSPSARRVPLPSRAASP